MNDVASAAPEGWAATAVPGAETDPALTAFVESWRALYRTFGRPPERGAVPPRPMAALLARMLIADAPGGGTACRIRVAGSAIEEIHGRPLAGSRIEGCGDASADDRVLARLLRAAVTRGAPVRGEGSWISADGECLLARGAAAPLGNARGEITGAAVCLTGLAAGGAGPPVAAPAPLNATA